ncbi:MAG: hypothetical protein QNK04_08940 [Myxococcota bacterium]|nr:hypothetical protein [Myxococcota bacterium]
MSGDRERPDFLDREKKSFSELDRERREKRSGGGSPGRSPAAQARSREATKQYLKQIDSLFDGGGRGEEETLARAMLDARGSPDLAAACRAYLEAAGAPTEARLLSCLLDAGDREIVLMGLAALTESHASGKLELSAGLRTQLRMLAQESDDEVAETAEDVLEGL